MPIKKKKQPKRKLARKKTPLKKKHSGIKRRAQKKPLKKAKKKITKPTTREQIIGVITHYFPKVMAAVVKLKNPLAVGDTLKIKGHTTNFTQKVISMQLDHSPIMSAKKGQEIGLLVNSRVRQHDLVCKG